MFCALLPSGGCNKCSALKCCHIVTQLSDTHQILLIVFWTRLAVMINPTQVYDYISLRAWSFLTQKAFSCNCLNDILHNNWVGLLAASKCYLPTRSRRISRLNQNFKWSNKIFKFVFKLKVQSTQHLIDINPRSCKNW